MALEGRPYRREAGSFDPRAAFVFEGVEPDELIGDFGLLFGGAASYEVDGIDIVFGTPGTRASARACFRVHAGWDSGARPRTAGRHGVLRDSPRGRGLLDRIDRLVRSTLHASYDNNVSRVTENVLRRFLSEGPLAPAGHARKPFPPMSRDLRIRASAV